MQSIFEEPAHFSLHGNVFGNGHHLDSFGTLVKMEECLLGTPPFYSETASPLLFKGLSSEAANSTLKR